MENQHLPAKRLIGLVPAAGKASRLGLLPCSKEVYPLGLRRDGHSVKQRVAAHSLLESMSAAGAQAVYIVLGAGKWDIPNFLSSDTTLDVPLAYVVARDSPHTPCTLDHAFHFVGRGDVLFGFPDTLFSPASAFIRLLERQRLANADVVLGLFPTDARRKMDMVELDEGGRVVSIDIKNDDSSSGYAWLIAVWSDVFTSFLHSFVAKESRVSEGAPRQARELYVGDVFLAAIDAGLVIDGVAFPDGECLDIGTPEDLMAAVRNETAQIMWKSK